MFPSTSRQNYDTFGAALRGGFEGVGETFKNLKFFRVPVNKELLTGTVPVNKELLTSTVPVNNFYH